MNSEFTDTSRKRACDHEHPHNIITWKIILAAKSLQGVGSWVRGSDIVFVGGRAWRFCGVLIQGDEGGLGRCITVHKRTDVISEKGEVTFVVFLLFYRPSVCSGAESDNETGTSTIMQQLRRPRPDRQYHKRRVGQAPK